MPYKTREVISTKEKENVENNKVHYVEAVIPLRQKFAVVKVCMAFTDDEIANRLAMDGKRQAILDEALKFYEEGRLVFRGQDQDVEQAPVPGNVVPFQAPPPQPAPYVAPPSPTSQSSNPPCAICGVQTSWRAPGVSHTTGKPYVGFWACPNYKNHTKT